MFANGFTYSGHPVACAAALANIDVITNDSLLEHARDVGPYFQERLRELADLPMVGDVRGLGLMGCVECVINKESRQPLELDYEVGIRIDAHCQALGLLVRPLINMAWDHSFNETFFEDVRVPVANRVGEEHRGWYVGATLLDFERSNISGAITARRSLNDLLEYAKSDEGSQYARLDEESVSVRQELAQTWIETEVQFNFSFRIISMQNNGEIPNYEASTAKLFNSELSQKLARSGTKTFGLYSNLWEGDLAPLNGRFTKRYVGSVSATIAAGTSEIQRNIIATRGLGLPRG